MKNSTKETRRETDKISNYILFRGQNIVLRRIPQKILRRFDEK